MPRPESIDAYLAAQPPAARAALARVRAALRKALPAAEEVISYSMPALRLDGRVVLFYAAWKSHWALYAVGEDLRRAFAAELAGLTFSKGAIQFPLDRPVPVGLVQRLARFRAAEAAAAAAAKRKRKAKAPAKRPRRPLTGRDTQ